MKKKIIKMKRPRKHPVDTMRYGQLVFNFLSWLYIEKGYEAHFLLADTFDISDKKFMELYKEYLKTL